MIAAEAYIDRLQKHVMHVRATDPGIGDSLPDDEFAIMSIEQKRHANNIAISASELLPIRV